jgi:glycosyltransferase involved in cell wall biosynthesis
MKLSIAMCTYNGARYLSDQLKSIAAQTRPADELVVCDDGSTDSTRAILSDFAKASPCPIQLHFNERNLGITKNFEQAILHCKGDVIFLSDQDDVWQPSKLAEVEAVFAGNPKVGMVFTDGRIVDKNRKPEGRTFETVWITPERQKMVRTGTAFELLLEQNIATGAAMAFRSAWTRLVTPIPVTCYYHHDGWIALLISAVADIEYIAQPLIDYRRHSEQHVGVDQEKRSWQFTILSRTDYAERMHNLETLYHRLSHLPTLQPGVRQIVQEIPQEIAHLKTRIGMPHNRLRRIGAVLNSLLTGDYARYSSGLRSAIRDVLFR